VKRLKELLRKLDKNRELWLRSRLGATRLVGLLLMSGTLQGKGPTRPSASARFPKDLHSPLRVFAQGSSIPV
jgi:hypothetical protein